MSMFRQNVRVRVCPNRITFENETKAARNKAIKSKVKTAVKKVEAAVAAKDTETAKAALHTAIVEISKAGTKGVYHKKTVSRKIARLSKAVDAIA